MKTNAMTIVGFVLMVIGTLIAMARPDTGAEGFAAFAGAAAPFVMLGLGLAMVVAGFAARKEK